MNTMAEKIRERMAVVAEDGTHVGTVDHVEGDRIKLTRSDNPDGGGHRYLPVSAVSSVEGDTIRLSGSGEEAEEEDDEEESDDSMRGGGSTP